MTVDELAEKLANTCVLDARASNLSVVIVVIDNQVEGGRVQYAARRFNPVELCGVLPGVLTGLAERIAGDLMPEPEQVSQERPS